MIQPVLTAPLSRASLRIDARRESDRVAGAIREQVTRTLGRRGVVIGLSGGVDSSVAAALAVRALGRERVIGLLMPERESSAESLRLGRVIAEHLGIEAIVEDLTAMLESSGCYARRDRAIRSIVPEFNDGCRFKLMFVRSGDGYTSSSIVVAGTDGRESRVRLTAEACRTIVAATSFKQRGRTMLAYFHADRLGYAVIGTANRLEYDQGFFVKNGDGAADLKPIAHLYKTQVYELASHLGIPSEICDRTPTTDTFTLEQSQEEFFFAADYHTLDLCLYALEHGYTDDDVCRALGLDSGALRRVFQDVSVKRAHARYLHCAPLLVEGD